MEAYWDWRFREGGRIWGDQPSRTAFLALDLFRKHNVSTVLVPGSGYGRNTRLFSTSGFEVTGVEISGVACTEARCFDPLSRFYHASALDMSFLAERFDAIYCFNVLHLFPAPERALLVEQCAARIKTTGLMYFTVFSEAEPSFGTGRETEENTFESKPGRPVHYFTGADLRRHFQGRQVVEYGTAADPEDHGGEPHTHLLRYICVLA
jgi:SAM-dependent methyltransferase